jgi:tetratricopeptide (TPR) repeat protein
VENIKKASEYFELAVHEDPDFALGYVGQADCSLVLENWGIDIEINHRNAKAMAIKALELDPGLAEALTTIASVHEYEHNLREAEEVFKRAIELKPSYATAHQWYYYLLLCQLRWSEALRQIEKAVELDPLSPVINYNLGIYYYAKREYSRAIELFKKVTELDPSYSPVHAELVSAYGVSGRIDDMRREVTTVVELLKGTFPTIQEWADCWTARYTNDKETLRRLLPQEEARINEPGHMASSLASLYFYLGENDNGFRLMELAYSKGEELSGIQYEPDFDGVRTDPRYLNLLKRLGLD